jgi:hypothetical protein
MVRWYDPTQLGRTAAQAVLAGLFGTYADRRELQAALSAPAHHDYSDRDELWLDYVADLGDGWDSTYTVARLLAEPTLAPRGVVGAALPRGSILVMGGDQVYPAPSRSAYRNRLRGPYRTALAHLDEDNPHLYAIPGNHDWYDGLTSFLRVFCQQGWIGAWRTRQRRSYFGLKLPQHWWLLAVDIQLHNYIDQPQLDYFSGLAQSMMPGDRVILCSAVPSWLDAAQCTAGHEDNLAFFERRLLAPRRVEVHVHLAGDLHHYCRYQRHDAKRHRITSGGGGAFLHGTHAGLPETLEINDVDGVREYRRSHVYPATGTSRLLTLRNLAFALLNWRFAGLLGGYYVLFGWLLCTNTGPTGEYLPSLLANASLGRAIATSLAALTHNPLAAAAVTLAVIGFTAACETPPGRQMLRIVVGFGHAAMHLALAVALLWMLVLAKNAAFGAGPAGAVQLAVLAAAGTAAGGFAGGLLFGLYLIATSNLLGLNMNSAFSSLRIPDYKHFLRLHIDAAGALRIYVLGVQRVVRHRRVADEKSEDRPGEQAPDLSVDNLCHLVEGPIEIDAGGRVDG